MKEIKAVIRPGKLGALRAALHALPGFPGMTVSKVEGCSASSRHVAHNIREELTDFTPKVRVEILAPPELADAIVDRIVQIGHTGQIGDGLVWMTEVARAVFIHPNGLENNPKALET